MADLQIALPTHDGRMEIVTLIQLLNDIGPALGRRAQFHIGEAGNIPRARNICVRLAETALRRENPSAHGGWILWVDSDIRLIPGGAGAVAACIRRAEAEGTAFSAHYRQADGRSTFSLGRAGGSEMLTAQAAASLPDWSALGTCGFGFLYVPMTFGYVFHADESGEDVHFWREHPRLSLRFAKAIRLLHHKAVLL